MSKLVILITSRIEDGHRVGLAWHEAGAPGVTFIESYGLRRLQEAAQSVEILPGVSSLMQILRENEETSLMVISVVEDDTVVAHLLDVTESILGDLLLPHTGVAFVLDVERTIGVRDHRRHRDGDKPPSTTQ